MRRVRGSDLSGKGGTPHPSGLSVSVAPLPATPRPEALSLLERRRPHDQRALPVPGRDWRLILARRWLEARWVQRGHYDGVAMLNSEGRPTVPHAANAAAVPETFTGNRGLQIEEPLLFEIGRTGRHRRRSARAAGGAVAPRRPRARRRRSICPASPSRRRCATMCASARRTMSIDTGIYPLGSCTMKHNPRLNEKMARLPGFADIHPLQPLSTVPGAIELIAELGRWLLEMTGMASVAMSPKAGAHGELCGMMAIKAALEARGENAHDRAGAGIRPRHQSGDRGAARLSRSSTSRPAPTAPSIPRRSRSPARPPTSPRSC